jgi:tRNA wybutosine-synthesizing protein 1
MARRKKTSKTNTKYYSKMRAQADAIPEPILQKLLKQKYHIVGRHSAVKMCQWTGNKLRGGIGCYKNAFYGIESHQCIQATPVLLFCNHACVFCWRMMPEDSLLQTPDGKTKPATTAGARTMLHSVNAHPPKATVKPAGFSPQSLAFSDMPTKSFAWDKPEKIVDEFILAHRKTVSGFGGNAKTSKKLFAEANAPRHVALSLTGEPSMYPYMSKLLEEFHARKISTFLVTNGTYPHLIAKWKTLPTQFYVSLVAPNKEVYLRAIRPLSPNLWEQYWKTLQMMPELGKTTRTVLRMTITRGVNEEPISGYIEQIKLAQPHYVEVKSMVFVGGARNPSRNLSLSSMLSIDEMRSYAKKLADATGYIIAGEHAPSRIVLLCRDENAKKERIIKFNVIFSH